MIRKFFQWVKGHREDIALLIAAVLISAGSFLLGRFSTTFTEKQPIIFQTPEGAARSPVLLPKTPAGETQPAQLTSQGPYVASRNGKAYHLFECPGAKQIKEENKLFFETKEAAEAAGYQPAANCPGLQ